jgi:uncharacterized protein (TIGR00369 family)
MAAASLSINRPLGWNNVYDRAMSALSDALFLEVLDLREDHAEVRQSIAPELRHANGAIPGPFLSGLADAAASWAIGTRLGLGETHATVSLSVQFVGAALDPTVTAHATVVRRARSLAFADVRILDESGGLCAQASGVWTIRPGTPNEAPA